MNSSHIRHLARQVIEEYPRLKPNTPDYFNTLIIIFTIRFRTYWDVRDADDALLKREKVENQGQGMNILLDDNA